MKIPDGVIYERGRVVSRSSAGTCRLLVDLGVKDEDPLCCSN